MQAEAQPTETAEERRKRQMEGVPDLPPLLAQILAETRAKQQRAKERAEQGLPPEEQEAKPKKAKEGGPLLLEGPSHGLIITTNDAPIPREPSDSEESSDDEGAADEPPGPPDARKCRAHGPGFSGAAAGQPVKLTITARDANGKRVREGGAFILVMVEPVAKGGEGEEEAEPIQATVEDHNNGSYTASYSVPAKGNYQLHIEVNGEPLEDSPFPVFFSAPVPVPASAPQDAAAAAAAAEAAATLGHVPPGSLPVLTADAIKAAQQQVVSAAGVAVAGADATAVGVASVHMSLGARMVKLGIKFPATMSEDRLRRIVVVGGVPAAATEEETRALEKEMEKLFASAGKIESCNVAGTGTGLAFVEFRKSDGAATALAMTNVTVKGQTVQLELASEAKKSADTIRAQEAARAAAPYLAIQQQQRQHFQLLQQQQIALAEQVAAMRAAQRTGVAPEKLAPKPHSNDSQKSAAMAAAIALSKKLAAGAAGGGGADAAAANGSDRKRSRSRSRSRDRDRRRRSRSRSRDRRRSRSRERRRSRDRDRRSSRREGSRERHSRRSRSRSRDRDRDGKRSGGSGKEHRHKHRHHHHHKERRRSRSRDRKERSERGEKEAAAGAAAAGAGGAEKMDWEAGEGQQQQGQQAKHVDELEALLDELGD